MGVLRGVRGQAQDRVRYLLYQHPTSLEDIFPFQMSFSGELQVSSPFLPPYLAHSPNLTQMGPRPVLRPYPRCP